MNKEQLDVLEFQEKVVRLDGIRDRLIYHGPMTPLDEKMCNGRLAHLQEELDEIGHAIDTQNVAALIDGLTDLIYVTYDFANRLGVDLEPFHKEVHRSNMTKTGGALNAEGKFIKPPTYTPPDIRGLLAGVRRACELRSKTRHLVDKYEFSPWNTGYHYNIRPDTEGIKRALEDILASETTSEEE